MPTYLIHGFRWQRKAIRIHVIVNNLDDASPDWIIAPPTSIALLNSFYSTFDFLPASDSPNISLETSPSPSLPRTTSSHSAPQNGREHSRKPDPVKSHSKFNDWSLVKLAEQYEISERGQQSVAQPYAYVGDYIHPIHLSHNISKEIETYEQRKTEELLSLSSAAGSGINTPTSNGSKSPGINATSIMGKVEGDGIDMPGNLEEAGKGIRKMSSRDFRRRKKRIGWLERLRDELQRDADIGWFVVVCEDEERSIETLSDENVKRPVTEGGKSRFKLRGIVVGNGNKVDGGDSVPPTPTNGFSPLLGVKKFLRRGSEKSLKACSGSSKSTKSK